MLRINKVIVFICLLAVQYPLFAQNNTNSPYTRYGYGVLADRSFGSGRAMGGIGYGLRSSEQINPMNPASYSSMDSLTFLFDFGVSGQLSRFDDGVNKQSDTNGNIEYIAMQFPISRRLALSFGLLPYSFVGYNYGIKVTDTDAPYINQFIGRGGLNEVYGGASIDIWKKRLSLGANVGYFFGTITHNSNVLLEGDSPYPVHRREELSVRDIKLDFGMQYTHPISADENFVLGLAFSPKADLNTKAYEMLTQAVQGGSSTSVDTLRNLAFGIPNSYGVGVSYNKKDKLMVGADFLYEDWSSVSFYGKPNEFRNRMKIGGGAEYIPGKMERSFFKRVRYRAGAHYSDSYQQIKSSVNGLDNVGYKEYGVSVGLGLPLVDGRSLLSMTFEYTNVVPQIKTMVDEQYFRITLNYTFNERWFYKFRLN